MNAYELRIIAASIGRSALILARLAGRLAPAVIVMAVGAYYEGKLFNLW